MTAPEHLKPADREGLARTYAQFQQQRGRLPDLIDECVEHYDGFMKDDSYDAWGCLRHIVERLRSAKDWYALPPEAERVEIPDGGWLTDYVASDKSRNYWMGRALEAEKRLAAYTPATPTEQPDQRAGEVERLREALGNIADLGSCARARTPAYKLFQEAIDIATGAL